ncbi:hypothetical protein B0T26DRAFT_672479 [Lasiosphaeria miniovina]|uniref:Uncharacterized protein n=1 Tax=Lasiosphaeria miniovina TaxID=1954250 RepID=A0AA40E4J4_9PEZI|nr:uncharacterized protein B0T26DRAFT_672479 [Lasiosphaeria miniovina]KAK0727864.1 hypothetical protein B0T26DRAFT_672479 [Lasiosphaeria miniovina]
MNESAVMSNVSAQATNTSRLLDPEVVGQTTASPEFSAWATVIIVVLFVVLLFNGFMGLHVTGKGARKPAESDHKLAPKDEHARTWKLNTSLTPVDNTLAPYSRGDGEPPNDEKGERRDSKKKS